MNSQSDSQLIRLIQDGDVEAFETLVRRYQNVLYRFVFRFVKSEQSALDIVQETLISLYKSVKKVDPDRKFTTYLFEIAKNKSLTHLRDTKKMLPLESLAEIEDDTSLMQQLYADDRKHAVQEAVASLPPNYRTVIRKYYFDELSYEQISTLLSIPLNTVRTHLKRGKAMLRKILPYEKS